MLIVVLLQYLIPRLPAGRVRDCMKCVICLFSYLSSYWTCSSQIVSSTDDVETVVTYCDVSFFPACSLLSLKSKTKRWSPYFMGTEDIYLKLSKRKYFA